MLSSAGISTTITSASPTTMWAGQARQTLFAITPAVEVVESEQLLTRTEPTSAPETAAPPANTAIRARSLVSVVLQENTKMKVQRSRTTATACAPLASIRVTWGRTKRPTAMACAPQQTCLVQRVNLPSVQVGEIQRTTTPLARTARWATTSHLRTPSNRVCIPMRGSLPQPTSPQAAQHLRVCRYRSTLHPSPPT